MQSGDHISQQIEMSRNVHDFSGIDRLRRAAQSGDKQALQEAANQFEAIFVQMMLKSMRKAQEALADKDSPFNSEQVKFYRDMHDQQLAVDLTAGGNMGIAKLIVQQLSPNEQGFTPASAIRSGANLNDISRALKGASASEPSPLNDRAQTTQPLAASKQAAFSSPEEFVKTLMPHVQGIANAMGLDPKALLAQAAVETGWGRYMIHNAQGQNSHNLFGIKADKRWQGDSALVSTLEFEQGIAKQQKAAFRSYDSFADGLKDYLNFVTNNPRYESALNVASDPKAYFSNLQQSGYATDPQYADKILSVLDSEVLTSALKKLGFGSDQ